MGHLFQLQNFHDAAADIGHKLETDPMSLTAGVSAHVALSIMTLTELTDIVQEANQLKSMEAKHTGVQQPPKDSISAAAARVVAAHERTRHVEEEAAAIAHKILDGQGKE